SSVSHWDISAEPSLLMEPFATPGLSRDPDLTVPLFSDIGWFGTPGLCAALSVDMPPRSASGVSMRAPYPDPTLLGTTVEFRLQRPEYVRLTVHDVSGRAIRTLHEGMVAPGEHRMQWDGLTSARAKVPPGVYVISLRTSEGVTTRRISV